MLKFFMVYVKLKPTFRGPFPNSKSRWIDRDTGLRKNYDGTLDKPEFMKIHRGRVTKKEKKVMAKVMYEAGWGSKRLSEWFHANPQTIINWTRVPTPEALQLFEQNFKAAMMDYDMQSSFAIKSKIMNLVPESKSIKDLVEAGKFFAGEREKRNSQNNTQVNIYGDMLKKYGEGTTEIPVKIISETVKK